MIGLASRFLGRGLGGRSHLLGLGCAGASSAVDSCETRTTSGSVNAGPKAEMTGELGRETGDRTGDETGDEAGTAIGTLLILGSDTTMSSCRVSVFSPPTMDDSLN